jgi:Ser-tRNA(Ala) deacylase AlaX
LTVEYKGEKVPTDAERASIEEAANKKVKENLFVEITEMDRAAAEAQFAKEFVNGQNIYEKKQPPASLVRPKTSIFWSMHFVSRLGIDLRVCQSNHV